MLSRTQIDAIQGLVMVAVMFVALVSVGVLTFKEMHIWRQLLSILLAS